MQHYQTYSKSRNYFPREITLESGKGSKVTDTEGNVYTDYLCALGPNIIGMADERINAAITAQLQKGISFSCPTLIEQELCNKLIEIIPGAESVKLMKNGKDVTMAAVRLARAYTGRDIILKGGYHGCDCWSIGIELGAKGIPQAVKDLTIKFKYNDVENLKELFTQYPNKIAGVIFEPVMDNGPAPKCFESSKDSKIPFPYTYTSGYLETVKDICEQNGAVLIFDEIVSGFRFALGGVAEYYKVTPDIMCIGKALGNGMPISAVCGRKDIMSLIDTGEAFISTTFGGETLSIAAALVTISILEQPGAYEHIWGMGQMMLDGLQQAIDKYKLNDCISTIGLPPHCGLKFSDIGSLDYLDLLSIYEQRMLNEGIIISDTGFISLSHSIDDIEHFILSAERAMSDLRLAIARNSTHGILTGRKISPIFRRH